MDLADSIRSAVADGRFVVSVHARERLAERNIRLWQVESGLETGSVVEVRPDTDPNPSIVVEQLLPDGTEIVVVWSWLQRASQAKLVTVYFPD